MPVAPAGADRGYEPLHLPMPCRHRPVGPPRNKAQPKPTNACLPSPCLRTAESLDPLLILQLQRHHGAGHGLPPPLARWLLAQIFPRLTRPCAIRFDQVPVSVHATMQRVRLSVLYGYFRNRLPIALEGV